VTETERGKPVASPYGKATRKSSRWGGATQTCSCGRKTYEYCQCKVCECVTHYARINMKRNDKVDVNARMMDPDDVAAIPVRRLDVRRRTRDRAEPPAAPDRGSP
jgi:hypothetical protein